MNDLKSKKGSALILSMIVGFLFLSGIVWFSDWGWRQSRAEEYSLASQRAFQYADSGINSARPWLKSPTATTMLPQGSSYSFSFPMPNGRCDMSFYRTSPDSSLVEAYATGYYFLKSGTMVDPVTSNKAQLAAIHAILRVTNVSEYLVAVPGNLPISYGANTTGGIIYAQSLTFLGPVGLNPPTQVGEADYTISASPSAAPNFVVFTSTPPMAHQLTYPPVFATLDTTMRDYYQNAATTQATPVFSGTVSAPSDAPIYFVNGDVDISQSSALNIQGVWVLYATGNIYIHDNITASGNNWAAFLSEKDIHITADAPDALTLVGNYVCNGTLTADPAGRFRSPGTIAFTGGLVIMSSIDLATNYTGAKTYTHYASSDPSLKLPNVSDMLQRNVYIGSNSSK